MENHRPPFALAPDDHHLLIQLALDEMPARACSEQLYRLRRDGLLEEGPTRYFASQKAIRMLFGVDRQELAETLGSCALQ
ncbi:MAG TPA: hypothetical protein VGE51_11950 [Fontimonas sp.]